MTFLQIQQRVFRKCKLPDTPASADSTRIQGFINDWHRQILSMPGFDRFRQSPNFSFTTVNGQKFYGLPQALQRQQDIYDLTNQRRILPRSVDYIRNVDPGLTATSSFVEHWVPFPGWGAVVQQLTQTGVPLYIVSDNAADTMVSTVETVRLGGIGAGLTTATLTGTSRVQFGSKSDHVEVVKWYLASAATGTISLYDAAVSGNLLGQITPGRQSSRYFMIQLYPTPGAAVTLTVDGQRRVTDLVDPTDEPLFPEDFHHVLYHYALADEFENRNDDRSAKELGRAERILSDLTHFVQTSPDEIPLQRGPRGYPQRVSRLGGWFPSGT